MEEYAAKLEANNQELQRFAYVAAHDMKEPLRKIQFYNSTLKDHLGATIAAKDHIYLDRSIAAAIRMQQLIDDLLAYAGLAMAEIALKYRHPSRSPETSVTYTTKEKNFVAHGPADQHFFHCVTILDNGIGFNQQYAGQMFDAFRRLHTQQEYPGTGIGLVICRTVMENHYGFIEAEGYPEQGAAFSFYIPLDH